MKRRKFIEASSLSLASLPFLSTLMACGEDEMKELVLIETDKKIAIVGAGIAGLAAAKYLTDRGVEVVVIEAQDKVGGRLKTDRSLGVAFDEGASWIHGPKNNPITSLAKEAGANTYKTDDDSVEVYDVDGSMYKESTLEKEESKYDDILDSIEGSQDESFETVFYNKYPDYKNNRLWTFMLSAYLEFDTGADIGELSSLDFYDDEAFSGGDLIITNGYDLIAEYLAQGLDVRLSTKVTGVDYSDDEVVISTDSGEIIADYAIVSVPLGVLKNEVISFTPSLSSSISNAISGLKMGSVNKYLCIWDEPFWDMDLQYIGYTPEEKGKFNYFLNVKKFANSYALMAFTFGDYSKQAESMTDEEIIAEIMSHLKNIYGDSIPNPTNMLRTKWVSNEYSFGSYSFATNGIRASAFRAFEEGMNDKLFFSGEHTSHDYRGTVHGAYLSGTREAKKIAALLKG